MTATYITIAVTGIHTETHIRMHTCRVVGNRGRRERKERRDEKRGIKD